MSRQSSGRSKTPSLKLSDDVWASLIVLAQQNKIYLEGNVLKVLDPGDSQAYQGYLRQAVAADAEKREKRLEVSKGVQATNSELIAAKEALEASEAELKAALEKAYRAQEEAEESRQDAERAREEAVKDLDYLQKRTQFELMGQIVRVALWVVVGVGAVTTGMYAVALFGPDTNASDTTLLANTWSNMFGILLTNSFSIIGTIMGVKYATDSREA